MNNQKNTYPSCSTDSNAERELILINISGADRTGLTAQLTEILACHGATVLDIGGPTFTMRSLWESLSRLTAARAAIS